MLSRGDYSFPRRTTHATKHYSVLFLLGCMSSLLPAFVYLFPQAVLPEKVLIPPHPHPGIPTWVFRFPRVITRLPRSPNPLSSITCCPAVDPNFDSCSVKWLFCCSPFGFPVPNMFYDIDDVCADFYTTGKIN